MIESVRETMIISGDDDVILEAERHTSALQEPDFSPVWSRSTAILLLQCGVFSLSQTSRSSAACGNRLENTSTCQIRRQTPFCHALVQTSGKKTAQIYFTCLSIRIGIFHLQNKSLQA